MKGCDLVDLGMFLIFSITCRLANGISFDQVSGGQRAVLSAFPSMATERN
jgi:hypothetical protein